MEAAALLADDITQQTERLRRHMSGRPGKPDAERDPFTFATPPQGEPVSQPSPSAILTDVPAKPHALEPPVSWPTLAAVVATDASGELTRTAVVGWGEEIEFLKPGDVFKDFIIVAISPESITLRHAPTKSLRMITLR